MKVTKAIGAALMLSTLPPPALADSNWHHEGNDLIVTPAERDDGTKIVISLNTQRKRTEVTLYEQTEESECYKDYLEFASGFQTFEVPARSTYNQETGLCKTEPTRQNGRVKLMQGVMGMAPALLLNEIVFLGEGKSQAMESWTNEIINDVNK